MVIVDRLGWVEGQLSNILLQESGFLLLAFEKIQRRLDGAEVSQVPFSNTASY